MRHASVTSSLRRSTFTCASHSTADAHVAPPARRTLVSRQANIVIVGGVVSGTWSLTDDQVVAVWFAEAGPPAREALAEEVARLARILDRSLQSTVQMA
jgi:hypothetical protein